MNGLGQVYSGGFVKGQNGCWASKHMASFVNDKTGAGPDLGGFGKVQGLLLSMTKLFFVN